MTEANISSSASEAFQQSRQRADPRGAAASPFPIAHIEDWQTVDFPNAISIDAIERQAMYEPADLTPPVAELAKRDRPEHAAIMADLTPASAAALPQPSNPSDRMRHSANQSVNQSVNPSVNPSIHPSATEPAPDVSDLIALIQELNQCNHALLNRVTQLEIALETAQSDPSLSAKGDRPPTTPQSSAPQSLAHQLEFALQANQRQQILLDTLTEQLDSSKERIAELEQDCARTQQRYQEQSQHMAETESLCRDLRSRLQRQQRYTLQYKVALEKSLDVPPPSYLLDMEAAAEQPLPAPSEAVPPERAIAQPRIQPWSGQVAIVASASKLDARLRSALLGDRTELPLPEETINPDAPASAAQAFSPDQDIANPSATDLSTDQSAAQSAAQSAPLMRSIEQTILPPKLAAFSSAHLASKPSSAPLHLPQPSLAPPTESTSDPESPSESPGETQPSEPTVSDLTADLDPTLLKQLDAAVQPLIDSVMDAIKHNRAPDVPATPDASSESLPQTAAPEPTSAKPTQQPAPPTVSPEAEESLWQDLARLINVSTDDVVQASLTGDFEAFAAIDYEAMDVKTTGSGATGSGATGSGATDAEAIANAQPPCPAGPNASVQPGAQPSDTIESSDRPAPQPTSKRKSLAAVDLPRFV
jgi:hypothetical protein